MRAGAEALQPAGERGWAQRRPKPSTNAGGRGGRPNQQANAKARCRPCARESHGAGAALFIWKGFRKKESGPGIAARPANIRGANDRIRTGDLRFTRALLYQLSHVGTRLLAKREYELYRRGCRFARGKSNFSGEQAGIRGFSTGLRAIATVRSESRLGAASPPTPRPRGPSPPARGPGPHAARSCSRYPACRAERPARDCP